ncbi:ketopantoate reductase family protein [Rarobacter incanus]|uniref:2-dehydropantoate 2-reductase n=1 Tax=Rarobacter incanus TaxID=153494 RepID=A0A542SPA8_9MICO|nr:2-dehydropantoate 2-reductase [Rarobacter incanus]TQK76456.1 ketopantoate reductase [Rarobacter incanus]
MQITVIGAGGLGAYYAAVLQRSGSSVQLFVTPRHLAPIRDHGIKLTTDSDEASVSPAAVTDQVRDLAQTPIVINTVKTYQLDSSIAATRASLLPDGIVLTLQNGVTSPGRLRAALGDNLVVPGLTGIVSAIESPGHVRQRGPQPFITMGDRPLGEAGASSQKSRIIQELVQRLKEAGVAADATGDITRELWKKFMLICTMSGVGTLCNAQLGEWRDFGPTRELLLQSVREVRAVANAHGIMVTDGDERQIIGQLDRAAAAATASMQRDLMAGHTSELSEQSGAVVRLAAEVGVAVPLHTTITRVLSLHAHRGHV